jgi:hypothetical protein
MGAWLARAAHLEAASVPAFAQLERELMAHRAPERLVAGARRARHDEIRHARMMSDLARAAGAGVAAAEVEPVAVRPLDELAVENAVEGCVRETLGAMIAFAQSSRTRDPVLSSVLGAIAVDEMRHGNLSWAIDNWVNRQLDAPARRRVDEARGQALRDWVEKA